MASEENSFQLPSLKISIIRMQPSTIQPFEAIIFHFGNLIIQIDSIFRTGLNSQECKRIKLFIICVSRRSVCQQRFDALHLLLELLKLNLSEKKPPLARQVRWNTNKTKSLMPHDLQNFRSQTLHKSYTFGFYFHSTSIARLEFSSKHFHKIRKLFCFIV